MKAEKSTAVIKGLAESTSSEAQPERQRAIPASERWYFKRADRPRPFLLPLCATAPESSYQADLLKESIWNLAPSSSQRRAALHNSQVESG